MGRAVVRLALAVGVAALGYLAVREAAERLGREELRPPRVRIEVPNPDL
ncbi:MAG TPA: hypothetical protein VNP94_11940 [Actinomycetota bacterium]|nr:hypothetical protein [Actinomycetota bacterium]